MGSNNIYVGELAGDPNTTGQYNSFVGYQAGSSNSTGSSNSFFGYQAGTNTFSNFNSFFGSQAGLTNSTGFSNSFFGVNAGAANTTGRDNSFFGNYVGDQNSTGDRNSFFGSSAGSNSSTGDYNSFFGFQAGVSNTTGSNNTIIGNFADVGSNNLTYATAIGAEAVVSNSNSIVLGRPNGSDTVRVPGVLSVTGSSLFNGTLAVTGSSASVFSGTVAVSTLGSAGSTSLCRNASNQISTCSSSARYKNNISSFNSGLSLINRLRPVSFNWKDGGMLDMGLVAEEVNAVEPLLTTTNASGEVEGVKYDRVGVVIINAVKEQQAQIEAQSARVEALERQNQLQKDRIATQQRQIDELKAIVCSLKPDAGGCKQEEK